MDVIASLQDYITKMISNIPGMKVFLLDKETMGIVSMVFSQSQVLQKEVYLFERLDEPKRTSMMHLKAICFLRPTNENRSLLETEFKNPKYGEYHLYFSNIVPERYIQDIAMADTKECVQTFQEYYADYFAVNKDLFSLNIDRFISPKQREWNFLQERTIEGIASVLLSLKKQPLIRFSSKSEVCEKICKEFQRKVKEDQALFDFPGRTKVPPLLLIYDRKDDPITPLLTQWTYQAMTHELIGIQNNKEVILNQGAKNQEHFVLSGVQDEWYKKSMFLNQGELVQKLQEELVDDLAAKSAKNQQRATIEDLKNIVEGFGEYKKQAGLVNKHVSLIGEIDNIQKRRKLLQVSEIEQNIANSFDHASHVQWVKDAISEGASTPNVQGRREPIIEHFDQLKLALIYALKYEDHPNNEIPAIRDLLEQKGHPRESVSMIDAMLRYAGKAVRSGELFAKSTIISAFANMGKFREDEIIYTQHKPYLKTVFDQLFTNKLKESEYSWFGNSTTQIPQDVIVFVVGGVTYEEAAFVHSFNKTSNFRVLLGGTKIHNAKSFLEDVAEFYRLSR